MTQESSAVSRRSDSLPQETIDLMVAISQLPLEHRRRIDPILRRVVESTRRRKRILRLVQEALSQLRLDMKYLMFDLEATRRERDSFQRLIDGAQAGEPVMGC